MRWGQVYIILTIQIDRIAKAGKFPFLLSILPQCYWETKIIFTTYSACVNLSMSFFYQICIRGCPHITSAAGGGEGVSQMLTIADGGGRGGKPNADDC